MFRSLRLLGLALASTVALVGLRPDASLAQTAADAPAAEEEVDEGLPDDDEAGKLNYYTGPTASHLGGVMDGVLAPYDRLRDTLNEKLGMNYIWYYSPVFQAGTQDEKRTTAHHEISFIGDWTFLDDSPAGTSGIRWWYLHQLTYGPNSVVDFSDSLGSSTLTNGGPGSASESLDVLGLLWYEHWLLDESLVLVGGKLDARQLVSRLRYVGDDRQDFSNHALFNKVVQPIFAAPSLGLFASYEWDDMWVSGMVKDGDANKAVIDFESVDNGNYQYAAEIGFIREPEGLGEGRYRITYFRNDETRGFDDEGWGVAFAADQDLDDRFSLFARLSRSQGQRRVLKAVASGGLIVRGVGPWVQDTIGLGFSWGDPARTDPRNRRDQYTVEAFWNVRVTPRIHITPDVQWIIQPAQHTSSAEFVGGVRLYVQL